MSSITMGGMASLTKTITTDTYSKLTREGVDFEADLSLVVDAVKAGGELKLTDQKQRMIQTELQVESSEMSYCGGVTDVTNPSFGEWAVSVDQNPVPIVVTVRPIEQIFDALYLPTESSLATKRNYLLRAIQEYYTKNGVRYIPELKDAVPVYRYASFQTNPPPPPPGGGDWNVKGSISCYDIRTPTVPLVAGEVWRKADYICMAFKEPKKDTAPVHEYVAGDNETYFRTEGSNLKPGSKKLRDSVFHVPKNPTSYSCEIHGWIWPLWSTLAESYQAAGKEPPTNIQASSKDAGLAFYGISTQIK